MAEYLKLKGKAVKANVGWVHYYDHVEFSHRQGVHMLAEMRKLHDKHAAAGTLPTHLKDEFVEMLTTLGRDFQCSICLETPQSTNIEISSCGHRYCKPCFGTLKTTTKQCAVCRRSIFS